MSEDLTPKKLKALIKFQRKFSLLKKNTDVINRKIYFYKEILMSMINNLSLCNNLKLFQETESMYMSILNEITAN